MEAFRLTRNPLPASRRQRSMTCLTTIHRLLPERKSRHFVSGSARLVGLDGLEPSTSVLSERNPHLRSCEDFPAGWGNRISRVSIKRQSSQEGKTRNLKPCKHPLWPPNLADAEYHLRAHHLAPSGKPLPTGHRPCSKTPGNPVKTTRQHMGRRRDPR